MPSKQKQNYDVEGLYGDDPDNWTVWRRNLTKDEALDLLKIGNSLTKGLRVVRVSKTIIKEKYTVPPKFKPQVAYLDIVGLRPISIEVTETHVRFSLYWNFKQRNVSFCHKKFQDMSQEDLSTVCFNHYMPLTLSDLKKIRSKVNAMIKVGSW